MVKLWISDGVKEKAHVLVSRRKLFLSIIYRLFIALITVTSEHFLDINDFSLTTHHRGSSPVRSSLLKDWAKATGQILSWKREQVPRSLALLLCAMQKTGLLYPSPATSASPSTFHVNPTKTDNVLDFNKHVPSNTIRSFTVLGAKQVGEPFWADNVIWHEVPVASWSRNKNVWGRVTCLQHPNN